ncbi:MAG: hypothetical protein P0S93_03325 [Candidatus Neptunochlamydia sp.]|nr:hypothetical protein [Candidatus Neptunochlamydia sp.]
MNISYTVYNSHKDMAAIYNHETREFKVLDKMVELDILEGIKIPVFLQTELKEKIFLSYPPEGEDIPLFALAFRKVIFENELVKHGFTLKEALPDSQSVRV